MKDVRLAPDDDGVPGVASTVEPDRRVILFTEIIDKLSLTLVPPLKTDDGEVSLHTARKTRRNLTSSVGHRAGERSGTTSLRMMFCWLRRVMAGRGRPRMEIRMPSE